MARRGAAARRLHRLRAPPRLAGRRPGAALGPPRRTGRCPRCCARTRSTGCWPAPRTGRWRGRRGEHDDAALAMRDAAVLELLYASAIRVGELCDLDLGGLDVHRRTVRVFGKGGKERVVPSGFPRCGRWRAGRTWGGPSSRTSGAEPPCSSARGAGAWIPRTARRVVHARLRAGGQAASTGRPWRPEHGRGGSGRSRPSRTPARRDQAHGGPHLLEGGADLRSVQEIFGHASPAPPRSIPMCQRSG